MFGGLCVFGLAGLFYASIGSFFFQPYFLTIFIGTWKLRLVIYMCDETIRIEILEDKNIEVVALVKVVF